MNQIFLLKLCESLQFCHGDTGCRHFEPETRHSLREAQVSKVECCFWFLLTNAKHWTGRCRFAHVNNTLIERSKFVATKEDLLKFKTVWSTIDVSESCTKQGAKTRLNFYTHKNVTVSAAPHRKVSMAREDAVLPEPLTKNLTVNCLTRKEGTTKPYSDKFCLFRAHILYLHGNGRLEEETSEVFNFFQENKWRSWSSTISGYLFKWYSNCGRLGWSNHFPVQYLHCKWSSDWWICRKKCWQTFQHCLNNTLQQSHLLCIQNQRFFETYRCSSYDQFSEKTGNLETHLTTWKKSVEHFFPKIVCQLPVKRSFTNLTCLLSFIQTTKSSLTTWLNLIWNQSVWKTKNSRIPKQQHGLGITSQFRYRYRPTWYNKLVSSAILNFVIWYHLSLMLWRIWLCIVKLKWKWTTFKFKRQWEKGLDVSKKH